MEVSAARGRIPLFSAGALVAATTRPGRGPPARPASPGGHAIASRSRSVILPALLLVLLLAAVDLWAAHHFGWGIRDPGQLALLLSAAGAAYGLVGWFLTQEERDDAWGKLRDTLRPVLLNPSLVLVLWAVFLVSTLLFSSLTLVPESGGQLGGVSVVRQDGTGDTVSLGGGVGLARVPLLTSPMAGPYVVRVEGYLPTTVEVPPLVGSRLRLGDDVARAPSLLIRPAGDALDALRLAGHVRVLRRDADGERQVAQSEPGAYGSFLLGPAQPTLRDRLANWERELIVEGVSTQLGVNRHLLEWQRVHPLSAEQELGPGDTVVVRVVSRTDRTMAEKEIVLRPVDLEDLFLGPGR